MLTCNMQKSKSRGFTMIEMLIVIVIILILSGMVLKIMTLVSYKAGVGKCVGELMQIENALAEYYSEYGQYPPGIRGARENVEYEFENTNLQATALIRAFEQHDIAGSGDFYPDVLPAYYEGQKLPGYLGGLSSANQGNANWGIGYRYGLVAHLWLRQMGAQRHWYRSDNERDITVKRKWAHFLSDVPLSYDYAGQSSSMAGFTSYSNSVATINDPWSGSYYYICKPPYYSYELWSAGPDGVNGTVDDVRSSGK